ncbi:MAG: coproporphyrinogen III oxidase [Rhodobacterales bacterium]|nr:MAG: coproporphyrinogen III oxidase [Rhodobacterales bacterium]
MPDWRRRAGFGIYLHWPFCAAKCPYCDFNSHVVAQVDQARWADAFVSEITRAAEEIGPRVVNTIYFGGGTPSLMAVETVDAILNAIRARFPIANDVEITLEANPNSVEAERFRGYRAAGVNRVSLGVQALNKSDLKRLGRLHSVDEALAAVALARDVFDRVSFDLIYARQDQTLPEWEAELAQALALEPDHLSLYQLTIEPGTAFGARFDAGKLRGLPDEDLGADMYELTQILCRSARLEAYEVSNYARPGQESRHNLTYWRGGDYLGIGPGAHGRVTLGETRYATETPLAPGAWLAQAEAGCGESLRAPLPDEDQRTELLMMGLRLQEGVDRQAFEELGGTVDGPAWEHVKNLGLLDISDRIALTEAGRPVLNAILRELI